MTPVNTTFYHDTLGKLRTVYTEDNLLFSVRDISRIFGYKDDGKTLRRYCSHVKNLEFGKQTMNFLSAADLDNLFRRGKYENSNELYNWICDTIIPELLELDYGDDDLYDENELYLIHRRDYDRLTYAFALLCHRLVKLCDKVDQLPVSTKTGRLLDLSARSREVCENLLDSYGLTLDDMKEFDTDRIFELLDEDVTTPENAGYMGREEMTAGFVHDLMDFLTDWKHSNGKSIEV